MAKKVYRLSNKASKGRLSRRRGMIVIVLAVALIGVGLGLASPKVDAPPVQTQAALNETAKPAAVTAEGRYLFSGTIVLGRGVEQQAQVAGGYDYGQPFSQFASFKPEQYDGWMADLECPVTPKVISFRDQVNNLQFNCRPEWLPELTKYISFLNLANNHTNDMGAAGFLETQRNLDAAGVQAVGNFSVTTTKDICEVMALPIRVTKSDDSVEKGTLPVAFCAWQYFFRNPQPGELEVMQRYAKIMPVFTFMHSGAEYFPTAAPNQVELARKLIDLGGEFVVGNSPHWVQNSEVYKDKLIVYSTGNFMFDQLDAETNRGLNLDVTFKTGYDKNLASWLELGDSCKARGDTCLEQAEKAGLQKIKLDYTFEPIASAGGYKQLTRRADATVQAAVEKRLDWANVRQQLQQPAGQ